MKRLLPVCLLLLAACGGTNEPECSDSKPCASGTCQAGKCVQAAACMDSSNGTAPNLVYNHDFECTKGSLDGWTEPLLGTLTATAGHNSANAAEVTLKTTTQGAVFLTTTNSVLNNPGGKNLCASAYLKGTAANSQIAIKRLGSNINDASAQPLTTDWARVDVSSTPSSADTGIYLAIGVPRGNVGDKIDIDDAQLWISNQPDGGCTER